MVVADDILFTVPQPQLPDDIGADLGMLLDFLVFLRGQPASLQKNVIPDPDFSDVVQVA